MRLPVELLLGLRYLRAKRTSLFVSIITLISTAGVALGVMALIVVLAVMTGFDRDLKDKILGTNAHIVVTRNGLPLQEYSALQQKVATLPGVRATTPFVYNQVMLSTGERVAGVVIRGVDGKSDPTVTKLKSSIVRGRYESMESGSSTDPFPGIIVGSELARSLGVVVGDRINVISPTGTLTPLGMMPRLKPFIVGGIFTTGMFEYDSSIAYISLTQAQRFFELGNAVTGIQVRVEDVYATPALVAEINSRYAPQIVARDWMQMNRNILFALKTEKVVMFIILTLIVLVAAFGIASTLFMIVTEKTKDIAILKTMGAPASCILKTFMVVGGVIGAIGTGIGVLAGLLIAHNLEPILNLVQMVTGKNFFSKDIYYLDHFPSQVVMTDVVSICVTTMVISLLASLYPAWRASKLLPVEALRYE